MDDEQTITTNERERIRLWETLLLNKLREPGVTDEIVLSLPPDDNEVFLSSFFHQCGTPACLAGHMSVMPIFSGLLQKVKSSPAGRFVCWPAEVAEQSAHRIFLMSDFGTALFGSSGAGYERVFSNAELYSARSKDHHTDAIHYDTLCVAMRLACASKIDGKPPERDAVLPEAIKEPVMAEYKRLVQLRADALTGIN